MRSLTLGAIFVVVSAAGACRPPDADDVRPRPGVALADTPNPVQPVVVERPTPLRQPPGAVTVGSERVVAGPNLSVESSAFPEGGLIPSKYTSDGANVSPPLSWSSGPSTTTSYALVMTDPDSTAGVWSHWVIWNIPATRLDEAVPPAPTLPNAAAQGTNSWTRLGYGGPQPTVGTGMHRYVFRVYALDTRLELGSETDRAALERAISGHVVASGELTGRYERTK